MAELAEELTAQEIEGYQAYYAIEPWGCEAADYRAGMTAHTVASCLSSGKHSLSDFVPQWDRKPKRATAKEWRAWAEAHNAQLAAGRLKV